MKISVNMDVDAADLKTISETVGLYLGSQSELERMPSPLQRMMIDVVPQVVAFLTDKRAG